jgi:predicted metal-dependent phosphoesterase TrpH
MIIDMHVHTSKGGYDSTLSIPQVIEEAEMKGIGGVCLTEHIYAWARKDLEGFACNHNVVLLGGMEIATDMGHIIVFGLDRYISGIHKASKLRSVADEMDGFLVVVHPFRMYFEPEDFGIKPKRSWPQVIADASDLPIFSLVDEVEVLNGGCTERENLLALEVARGLEMRGTGGSDAHSERGVGYFVTVFEREIRSESDLITELKAGRFYPAKRLRSGEIIRYGNEAPDG